MMALGTWKLFNSFGETGIQKLTDVTRGGYNLAWALTGNSQSRYPITEDDSWNWSSAQHYQDPDFNGQDWYRYTSASLDYNEGICTVSIPPLVLGQGNYLGNTSVETRSLYYAVLTQRQGNDARIGTDLLIGFVDLTTDGGTTGWDIWSAPATIAFTNNIAWTVRINR